MCSTVLGVKSDETRSKSRQCQLVVIATKDALQSVLYLLFPITDECMGFVRDGGIRVVEVAMTRRCLMMKVKEVGKRLKSGEVKVER